MFVTIVEAVVEGDREDDLRAAWDEVTAGVPPPGLIESSLLRTEDRTWRIVTVWESKAAVLAMRATGATPAALVVFDRAGAKPSVSMSTVERRVESRRDDPPVVGSAPAYGAGSESS
jgi:heme-degrading monooxygenase HmoA